MLRNPELRRALLVGGLLTLLASAAAMSLSGWQAACVALALGTVLLVLYGVELPLPGHGPPGGRHRRRAARQR